MTPKPYSVVWFKRDLRITDHKPLHEAASRGPVLCLYVIEPNLWKEPDVAAQHYQFILESLRDLYAALRSVGGRLFLVTGEVVDILSRLHASAPFSALYSHEETGNAFTYARDREVGRWCRKYGVRWQEYPQFGVTRGLQNRDLWQDHWRRHHSVTPLHTPRIQPIALPWIEPAPPTAHSLGLHPHDPPQRQRGGRNPALATLQEFLSDRSAWYRGGISSPLSAPTACSRLSPYLAYGCLSTREVKQAAERTRNSADERRRAGISAFLSRMHWHCHFIQKLESEPAIEFRNMHRGYDGLREPFWNPAHFAALTSGSTGWPLVDACVSMLRETGWINFRMRAMLTSVAAYPLWLHWRPFGLWLARQFLDYEPGIHWSQLQMQSGTTGINTTRVYNPIKQARDHDPDGRFVRRWLPHLRKVPDIWIFEPWLMPESVQTRCGVFVGKEILVPVVDLETATRHAKQRLHELRAQSVVKAAKADIVKRHGSRKMHHVKSKPKSPKLPGQAAFDFSES